MKYEIHHSTCPDSNKQCYFVLLTQLYSNSTFRRVYRGVWLIVGGFIPLAVMATCNTHLLAAIYRSNRRTMTNGDEGVYPMSRITLLLVSIVIAFLILVFPASLVGFIGDMLFPHSLKQLYSYRVAIVIFNVTQTIFFSLQFVLYCSVSRAFRESLRCSNMFTRSRNYHYNRAIAVHMNRMK